ncbi:MAG: WYL domain-containing protein [Lachnospiraceae bacterium]|nr:WYL domain-containing protein [Lachnospiraceae bacterium]
MSRAQNQKLKLYVLGKILMENTDEDHGMTMKEIIKRLEREDIPADRKSIYDDIRVLEDIGICVETEKVGKYYYYKVVGKQFEVAELKLLVDSVSASKFITEKKSKELIGKLEGLVSKYEAKELQRTVLVSGRNKTQNEGIYYNVDAIHTAMNENKKISFEYLQWTVEKKLIKKKEEKYVVSPWSLLWDEENYYLIAFDETIGIMKHYRVDKMRGISSLEEKRAGVEEYEKLDMTSYTDRVFGMFAGKEETVTLIAKNYLVGVVLDRFGTDIPLRKEDKDHFRCRVKVALSGQFYGWVFSFGGEMKIAAPEYVVEAYRGELEKQLPKSYE